MADLMLVRLLAVSLSAVFLVGCPGKTETPPSDPTTPGGGSDTRTEIQPAAPAGTMETAAAKPVEVFSNGEKRESTAGRWLMSVMKPQFSLPGMTIDLAPGKPPEIVTTSQVMETWKVLDSEVGETSLTITFSNVNGDPVIIQAELDNSEALRGHAVYGIDGLDFVEFVPTGEVDLSEAKRLPHPAAREFAALLQKNRELVPADARAFAEKLPATPVKIAIFQQLLQNGVASGSFDEEILKDCDALVESAAPWGQRFQAQQAMMVIASLTTMPDVPVDALKQWYDKTKTLAGDEPTEQVATALSIGNAALAARDETFPDEDAQTAIDQLVALLPHQAITYQIRSTFAKRKGDTETALRLEAELIALPMPGGDPKAFEQMYESVHESTDGLPAYLDNVYDEVLTSFASEPVDGVGETSVLIELFTGGACQPCVAADVALEAIEETFPDNVHVIRYHMDIPAPDPLSTSAGVNRFSAAYRLQGTPSIVVNGVPRQIPGAQGPYPFAKIGYANLSSLVKLLSNEEPAAKVGVAAVRKSDTIRIIARAEELPEDSNPSIVVAVVSNSLRMLMPNGIREHSMVVRAFPAGPVGTARPKQEPADSDVAKEAAEPANDADAKDADEVAGFEIITETSISELTEQLVSGLSISKEVIEVNRGVITNLDDLYAVAFVQDGTTGQILGSAKTKISISESSQSEGDETAPAEKTTSKPPAKAESTEKAETPVNEGKTTDGPTGEPAPSNPAPPVEASAEAPAASETE